MNPWVVGHVLMPLHEFLMRRGTFAVYRDLQQSQWWPRQRLHDLQLQKLRALVAVALEQTEWYAEFAGMDRGWLPRGLEDLRRLPLIDKATISSHREQLVNRAVTGGPIHYRTGGSSGQPLIFYFDKRRQAYDKAARMRTHEWWGVLPGDREAYIWNSPVELSRQDKLKHLRDALTNERLFPASNLSETSIRSFVDGLVRFAPKCLFGYPSAITLAVQLARRHGLDLRRVPVQVVFSTAEVLYEHQKQAVSEAFGGVPVVNGYGSREAGFIAHECPEGRMHVTSENVIVEVLREGRTAAPGEDGEIVVTQLDNHAMPFIRYRTGDIGQWSDEACPCGRGLEVMTVVKGRSNDFLRTRDGRWVHGSAVHAALSDIPGIVNYQLIQEPDYQIRILLVADATFPRDAPERLKARLTERLGPGCPISIEFCEGIAPSASGKHRYIISHMQADRG